MLNTKSILALIALPLAGSAALSSCDDSTNVGGSLVTDESQIVVATDFTVTGQTVVNPNVQSRTIVQVLGRFEAEGYGTFSSDFVTQFMPAATIPTTGITVNDIDSLQLVMRIPKNAWVGDTLLPMGLEVYRLNRQLPAPIFSDFDPEGYYDTADKLAEKMYVCNALGATDSIRKLSYREINVTLPRSLGQELFQLYLDHPEAYTFPANFSRYFPGIYVRNSFGSGRVVAISTTTMRLYYHTTSTDSEGKEVINRQSGNYYAVTPEVILNNNIDYTIDDALQARIDAGEQILVAPVGRDVEMTFPLQKVIDYYHENAGSLSVVNTLTIDIPATAIENEYGIEPPTNLLLILKAKKDEFFRKNMLTDDISSFYATYDSANHRYRFSGLRGYLLEALKKESFTPDDYEFVLTPVNVETETNQSNSYYYNTPSTYVSAINPYVGAPALVKLDLDKCTVTFTFSKQTVQ